MMSKKHHNAIALAIRTARPSVKLTRGVMEEKYAAVGMDAACDFIAYDLAEFLAEDNAKFDRTKFLTACGVS